MPDKNNESSGYRAYLIRLWPVRSRGRRVWRASAENAHNGERHAFADLAHLFTFLKRRPNPTKSTMMTRSTPMTEFRYFFRLCLLAVPLAIAGLVFTAAPAFACGGGVLCVDTDSPGTSPDGLTWTTAYTNVQDALAAANPSDEVWVAEGIYTPDVGGGNTPGDPTATFWLETGVEIYGGFVATETLRTQRDWDAHLTILSGDLAGDDTTTNGMVMDWSDVATATTNTYQILRAGDYPSLRADETAVLDGFTVTGGLDMRNDSNILHGLGAGLFSYHSNPTLRHLVFSGNKAYGPGGGVYSYWDSLDTSSPTELTGVTFRGNSGVQGAGLYGRMAAFTLDGCVFEDNATHSGSAGQSGGGLGIANGLLTMTDCSFTNNTAGMGAGLEVYYTQVVMNGVVFEGNRATDGNTGGGAMESEMSSLNLTDVSFIKNSVNGRGGGLSHMNDDTSPALFTDVSFIGNSASYGGGGLYLVQATALITNAYFAGNSAGSVGGGLLTDYYPITMTNGVFQGNKADWYGGGLALCGGDSSLTNLTVAGNDSANGAGIINGCPGFPSAQLTVANSIVYSNTTGSAISRFSGAVTTTYSIVNGGCPSGATCSAVSDVNPAFVLPVVPSSVPTSTGNLRLRLTSPAIDAGDNSAVPSGLTSDVDGSPRFLDIHSVTDTGNGTAPIVDIGAYEFSGSIPDLHAVKADDVDGKVAAGTPFSWTVTISNTGSGVAEFSSGNTLLLDNMPIGPTYGTPSVRNSSGLTGTVNCGVASSNLTCSANGGTVQLGSGGRFTVFIPVTPSAVITLTNPRSGAGCSVDPQQRNR